MGGNDVAPEVFTLFRADALAMGALSALLARQPDGRMRLAAWSQSAGWVLGLTLVALTIGNRRWLTVPDTLFAAFFACLVVATTSAPTSALASRCFSAGWLRFFGKYSYGMYIFQYPLIPILAPILSVELLSDRLGSGWVARIAYIVLMTTITTVVAYASWHLYERHFLSFKRLFSSGAVRIT
jgi:peptidoglycan/LPS O-acetylase OafA/YrhL